MCVDLGMYSLWCKLINFAAVLCHVHMREVLMILGHPLSLRLTVIVTEKKFHKLFFFSLLETGICAVT